MIMTTVITPAVHSVFQDTITILVRIARNVTFTAKGVMTVSVTVAIPMTALRTFANMQTVHQTDVLGIQTLTVATVLMAFITVIKSVIVVTMPTVIVPLLLVVTVVFPDSLEQAIVALANALVTVSLV